MSWLKVYFVCRDCGRKHEAPREQCSKCGGDVHRIVILEKAAKKALWSRSR